MRARQVAAICLCEAAMHAQDDVDLVAENRRAATLPAVLKPAGGLVHKGPDFQAVSVW